MKAVLEYSKGSNEGEAIYLGDEKSARRIAGAKCRGNITPIKSFTLNESDLVRLIEEAKLLLVKIRKDMRNKARGEK